MVRASVLLLVASCGRIGFDGGEGTVDAPPLTAAVCNPHSAGALNVGATSSVLRAAKISTGFAVGIQAEGGGVYVARVPSDFSTAEVHFPLGGYALGSISTLQDEVFVQAIDGGTAYTKHLDATWDNYMTVAGADPLRVDPQIAAITPTTGFHGVIAGGSFNVDIVSSDGTLAGSIGDYTPAATAASLTKVPGGVRVATDAGDGSCETFVVSQAGVTTLKHRRTPCSKPDVAAFVNGPSVIAFANGPNVDLYMIPEDSSGTGTLRMIENATLPRIAAVGGALWVVYSKDGAVKLRRLDASGVLGDAVVVASANGPFDITPDGVFWLDGSTLRVGTPCLR